MLLNYIVLGCPPVAYKDEQNHGGFDACQPRSPNVKTYNETKCLFYRYKKKRSKESFNFELFL